MITEDYVSFEISKLLKEKGFDEHCFCINYPLSEGEHHSIILPNLLNNSMIPFIDEYKFCRYKEDFITIPTLQMAIKWLREVHNIHIDIDPDWASKGGFAVIGYCFNIHSIVNPWYEDLVTYPTYEQAVEAAIKYCLDLI